MQDVIDAEGLAEAANIAEVALSIRDDPRVQQFVEVAKRLHISRAALYQRLARIREEVRVDLDDGESMTPLHVAIMVLDRAGVGAPQ